MNRKILAIIAVALVAAGLKIPASFACCAIAPAEFHNTTGWIGEFHRKGKPVHLLAYENVAKNLNFSVRSDGSRGPGGNAMLLPIPAVPGTMSDKNLLDGKDFKGLVEAVYRSSRDPIERVWDQILSASNSLNSYNPAAEPVQIQVFSKGSYSVVLSNSAAAIPSAISRLPPNKRPPINQKLFDAYDKWYPGCTFALCCFDQSFGDTEPLVWWYEPKDPNQLFFPAVDEHSGDIPPMDAMVAVDHRLAVTSDLMLPIPDGFGAVHPVAFYSPLPEPAGGFIPKYCLGQHFKNSRLQGDFTFNVLDVRAGIFRPHRTPPPGAQANPFLAMMSDLGEDSESRINKVLLGWFLSGWLLLFFRRWWLAACLIFGAPAMVWFAKSFLFVLPPSTVPSMLGTSAMSSALFLLLAICPIILIAEDRVSASTSLFFGTIGVALAAFVFPSWSSATYPLWWTALAVGAAIEYSHKE